MKKMEECYRDEEDGNATETEKMGIFIDSNISWKSTSAKWLQNAAKINAMKIQYVACPNQQVGVIIAKMNPADLKRIGVSVVSSSNETDNSGENHVNGGMDKERIVPTFNSSITALGLFRSFFKRELKETLLAITENEDAKWSRPKGCGFIAVDP
ncbi:PREDICTED: uncharacterized protein LOC103338028 [Prunus mume]|uniref:Uncharacterized protein LOC103338028 n=1 Tax=Prunus mume TaxID=102107 RepID=A0ABM0PGU4_PRUMU|nr:PREDICTED: uncharacterized protein LOC103338028 [Prunus mume]